MVRIIGSPNRPKTYQELKNKWEHCQRCPIHEKRNHIVHLRGKLPAKVFFIGEAPGDAEDTFGYPFKGVAGHLFDELLEQSYEVAFPDLQFPPQKILSYAVGNLIACLPSAKVYANQGIQVTNWEPTKDEIKNCAEHLDDMFTMVRPILVVTLGQLPAAVVKKKNFQELLGYSPELLGLTHPSAIQRQPNDRNKISMAKTFIARLSGSLRRIRRG